MPDPRPTAQLHRSLKGGVGSTRGRAEAGRPAGRFRSTTVVNGTAGGGYSGTRIEREVRPLMLATFKPRVSAASTRTFMCREVPLMSPYASSGPVARDQGPCGSRPTRLTPPAGPSPRTQAPSRFSVEHPPGRAQPHRIPTHHDDIDGPAGREKRRPNRRVLRAPRPDLARVLVLRLDEQERRPACRRALPVACGGSNGNAP